jgi:L-asparaginase II
MTPSSSPASAHPVLVEALRGGAVESRHRGALAVVDADGGVLLALGDIDRAIFPRSANKLLQALPLVASGAAERYGLGDAELALACASHGGEAMHTTTAAAALARAGQDHTALECGAHWPYHDTSLKALARSGDEPTALHNNCSGKHTGFVCLGCHMADGKDARGFLRGYVQPEHAVMQEVTAAIQATTGFDLATTVRGTDGCSIPTFAIPLRHLALAYARVATGQGLSTGHAAAALRLRQAVAAAPQMVAGTGRFDTCVMTALGERVCCKVGAEGVYCAAFPELGLGVAVKMDDGNTARAVEVVMAAVIEALLPLQGEAAALLASLSDVRLTNWNGIHVGSLRASVGLRQALSRAPTTA